MEVVVLEIGWVWYMILPYVFTRRLTQAASRGVETARQHTSLLYSYLPQGLRSIALMHPSTNFSQS